MIRENTSPANALTIDVEDYFQVSGFENVVRRSDWDQYPSRVVDNTNRLLDLLDEFHVPATFFVLAWVADRFPKLVREIHQRGHEIGTHSFWHRLIYQQTPDEFRADLRASRDALQQLIGKPIRAFRAPSFSITPASNWALAVLVEEGIEIDSSIMPVVHDRYGFPGAPRELHRLQTASGPLWEFPPSTAKLGRMTLPVSGGGYFRLLPYHVTSYFLRRINQQDKPWMFYLHPWEIDPEQPRIEGSSKLSRFRHYVNLSKTEAKLRRLLGEFRFAPLSELVA